MLALILPAAFAQTSSGICGAAFGRLIGPILSHGCALAWIQGALMLQDVCAAREIEGYSATRGRSVGEGTDGWSMK
jgi:hypothetical protein